MGELLNRYIFSSPTLVNIMTLLDEEDDYWDQVFVILYQQDYLTFAANTLHRRPCRTRPFSGHELVTDLLNGHSDRGYQHFRMSTTNFMALRNVLLARGLIRATRRMTADEQLAIFLFCVGHGVGNRVLAETFQHSGETISRHFNNVLRALVMLKDEYMNLPPSNVTTHPRIRDNINFHPFKNAIGAIDGTHIPVCVEKSEQPRFRCRKGFTSQNMMAAVSFDHIFFFICTGWEGSAADMRVLRWACDSGGFTVPEGKYYLVDSGYANTDRFLAPYRGERYHLSQFDTSTRARTHQNPRDLYNHRHAQLRNVVEKSFGILKKRFKILTQATPFPIKVQCLIPMACCVLHNFIRRQQGNDRYFVEQLEQEAPEGDVGDPEPIPSGGDGTTRGESLRRSITDQLWNNRS
ncbi:putative nuclease HARBI1, partial [Ananas comosus]